MAEGCRDPLLTWNNILVDGHNRYEICNRRGISFKVNEIQSENIEDIKVWIIDNQRGRRNLTDGWKFELAQVRKEILLKQGREKQKETLKKGNEMPDLSTIDKTEEHNTQKEIAAELGWSTGKVAMADIVWKEAKPEVIKSIKNGDTTINRAYKEIKSEEKIKAKKEQIEQTYEDRRNKTTSKESVIYLEDCVSFLNRFESKSVDLLLTDPPYSTDLKDLAGFLDSWLYDALDKVKDTGRVFICIGAYPIEVETYLKYLLKTNWIVDCPLIWTYRNTLGQTPKMKYNLNYQFIFHLYKLSSFPLDNRITNEMFSVQDINAPDGRLGNREYKWQKPDQLAERLIMHTTKDNGIVIDPFAGSGTFVLNATLKNRIAYGCEIDPEVLQIAERRGCHVQR